MNPVLLISRTENSVLISCSVFSSLSDRTNPVNSSIDNIPSSSLSISKNRFFNSPISSSESCDAKNTNTDFLSLSYLAYSSIWVRVAIDGVIFFFSWPNLIHLWARTSYARSRFSDLVRHFLIRSLTSLEIQTHSEPLKDKKKKKVHILMFKRCIKMSHLKKDCLKYLENRRLLS